MQHTEGFPKSERFRLAARLENTAFTLYEQLARVARGQGGGNGLSEADSTLGLLRFYLRLSHDRELFSHEQYQFAAAGLIEIGKILGGWKKTISTRTFASQEDA